MQTAGRGEEGGDRGTTAVPTHALLHGIYRREEEEEEEDASYFLLFFLFVRIPFLWDFFGALYIFLGQAWEERQRGFQRAALRGQRTGNRDKKCAPVV